MESGKLRHRVIVQSPVSIEDTNGEHVQDWSEVMQAKAAIEPLSVREQFMAEQQHASATHRLRFHFRAALAALTGSERVLYKDRVFILIGLPKTVDEHNREVHLLCEEGLRQE